MMTENVSAEEHLEKYKIKLGDDYGKLCYSLDQELNQLYLMSEQYEQLFTVNVERVELMNQTAPLFFNVVQNALWDSLLLGIARIIDYPKSRGKSNLTIQLIPEYEKNLGERDAVNLKVEHAKRLAMFTKSWRNQRIAHRDLLTAMNTSSELLDPASLIKIKEALKAIGNVLNWVNIKYFKKEVIYEIGDNLGGAESMLTYLRDGLEEKKKYLEKLRNNSENVIRKKLRSI